MGRAFAEVCKFVGCLPSELYKYHDPTIGDFAFVAALKVIEDEEIQEMMGRSAQISSGVRGGSIMPHMPFKRSR